MKIKIAVLTIVVLFPFVTLRAAVLRVTPHYGTIDTKSYDFRLKHEMQDRTFVMAIDTGYDIRTNDIISLQVSQHFEIGR